MTLFWFASVYLGVCQLYRLMRKQGTQLGWLIDPKDESVMIFEPNQFPEIKSEVEILPVLESVQEMQLSVKEMFNWLNIE